MYSSIILVAIIGLALSDPVPNLDYPNMDFKDDIFEQPMNVLLPKSAHMKNNLDSIDVPKSNEYLPYDVLDFGGMLEDARSNLPSPDQNRIKRKAKRRKSHKKNKSSESKDAKKSASSSKPSLRTKKIKNGTMYYQGDSQGGRFIEVPKDLYQAHLRPGVIFRIHLSEAILKMQYRNYRKDRDESVIDADVEYLRLTRKVISDEITKFEDLKWLVGWFQNRSELIQEHSCNTRYYAVGIPPTMFTHKEEYMKRLCLFDSVYIDHIPYVVGEDQSLMAAVAPPVLHCDAGTCTSVPFVDSLMFEDKLPRTNVRNISRCQLSCRITCKNDPDCLKKCSDRCLKMS